MEHCEGEDQGPRHRLRQGGHQTGIAVVVSIIDGIHGLQYGQLYLYHGHGLSLIFCPKQYNTTIKNNK